MVRKNSVEEFKRRPVDLYESTTGATANAIANDLGVGASMLWKWIRQYGTGTKTPAIGSAKAPSAHEPVAAKIARLELENLPLRLLKSYAPMTGFALPRFHPLAGLW